MIEGLDALLGRFGIVPKAISLYEMAFTHASYTNEHPNSPSYDRLEFLGDAVLDLVIASYAYKNFPTLNSGQLSKVRALLVEGKTLTDFSENRFGFASLVRYSVGEKGNTRFHKHINEDIFEAFIGAVYLDQGFAFAERLLLDIYVPVIPDLLKELDNSDPKSRLQEILISNIDYVCVDQKNLNSPDVCYVVEARVKGTVLGVGKGHNIKEAEMASARDALSKRVGD